jgi:ribonucleoside-diphosphate reductase alpha chain
MSDNIDNQSKEKKEDVGYRVIKRDGSREPITIEKIHKVLEWATEGLSGVSVSDIEIKARIQFKNDIKTSDIHEILAKTAADMISETNPNYQYVASRLRLFSLRKEVFGQYNPPHLYKYAQKMVKKNQYTEELLEAYSDDEFDQMNNFINHNRDLTLTWAALAQMEGKYLRKNRTTGEIHETPQFLYIMVAATIFMQYPKETRMDWIKKCYDAVSTYDISMPTPIMAGLRTPVKQFSSCVLIETSDSLKSINASAAAIVEYISKKAGIGINAGPIRGLGSPIRGGESAHTGVIPFYKHFQTAVKSCSQGGVRGGAATLFVPLWHFEMEEILVLKNNKGSDDNRVRHLDYGIQMNGFLYQRLIDDKNISLFSPSDVEGLYDAFFEDQDEFARLYEKYENDKSIRRSTIKAIDLFDLYIRERMGTGRIYFQHVDHCNEHGPFNPKKAPIRQSNLCLEIALPTKPLQFTDDPEGEIALCTLLAYNLGKIPLFDFNDKENTKDTLKWFEDKAELSVRMLDAILSYQEYPVEAAKKSTMKYRPLGIGVTNYAYHLAKHGVQYSNDTAIKLTNHTFEAMQYYTMKASVKLAKEFGRCEGFDNLKLAEGSLPIDRYKKSIDEVLEENNALENYCDWEGLRKDLLKYGIRNATTTALMPSETSSQIANATNGIEPPRNFVSIKQSKDGILKQVIPEIENDYIKWNYEMLWDQESPRGYIKLVGVMQKWIDQAISGNTSYHPKHFEDRKLSIKMLLEDQMLCYKYGWKTGYYFNTNDDNSDDDCDACKI